MNILIILTSLDQLGDTGEKYEINTVCNQH